MSAKVFLLNESGLKPEKVKRSAADYLCRVLMAVKVSQFVYQRLKVRSTEALKLTPNCPASGRRGYIPEKLPSHKTPGTKAKGPVVEQSRIGIFRIMQANHLAHAGRQ